jgi:hypothetical protein
MRVVDEPQRPEADAGREQPVDHDIVEVTRDPLTVLDQQSRLTVLTGLSELERERRLFGQATSPTG